MPVVVHTIHGLPFFKYQGWLANWGYILAERVAAGWCEGLIAVAEDLVEQAETARIAPRGKFRTIYSGLEVDDFQAVPAGWHRGNIRYGNSDTQV